MTFLKNTLYVLAANFLILALSFFLRPFTARFLGPAEYGLFAHILSTAPVIQAFNLFSINSGVLYYSAKKPASLKKIVSSSLAFVVIISVLLYYPLQTLVSSIIPSIGSGSFAVALALSAFLSFFSILQAAQQGLEKFRAYSIYSIASALLAGLASVAIAYVIPDGTMASLARAFAILAVSLSGLVSLKAIGKQDFKEFKRIFAYSFPLGLTGFLGAFVVIADRYLIAAFHSVSEVGFYDAAYSMIAAVLPFSTALLTTMMPRVIKQYSKLRFYYEKISQANAILLTSAGLVFFYYSDIFVTILLGNGYEQAVLPFKILSLSLPLMALYSLNVSSAAAVGKTKFSGLQMSLLTVFSFVFNFLLVPSLGVVGASWANLFTYVFTCAIGFYYLKTRYGTGITHVLPQYAFFAVFILAYVLFLSPGGFVAKTLLLLVFGAVTYFANKGIVAEVLGSLASMALRKGKL